MAYFYFWDLGSERLSVLKGRDLWWNALQWGEETCRAHLQQKVRASSGGWSCHPTVKTLTIIVPVWKNYKDGNGKESKEKKVQWQAQSGMQLKGRSQDLTLLLRLWSAHKKEPSMTVPRKTQQAAERVKCSFLHPTNVQKQLTPVVELGEAGRSWGGWQPCSLN